ncbi:tol-pal system protein YbgF [Pikeienuella sp. HZG-20]|uniref:tol-pal system protein YbgF n=1 Tax=Paludibacillus litoralis TaxID=3133267 RepID=UPI0030ECAA99
MNFTLRFGVLAAALVGLSIGAWAPGGAAQGVDRYEFLEVQKQTKALAEDVARLRGAVGGGVLAPRLDAVESEIQRLTGQIERLEYAQRQHEAAARQKLQDLEYRIIELEGGDPSVLFENQDDAGRAPGPGAPISEGDRAGFDAGVAAARDGRTEEARSLLSEFLSDHPESPLAGDAHFWLGEAYFAAGDYQAAAQRYLDGATLGSGSDKAPESFLKLGVTLDLLGKTDVACSTLREVRERYAEATDIVERAAREARRIGCE